jgi:hypothetical protein
MRRGGIGHGRDVETNASAHVLVGRPWMGTSSRKCDVAKKPFALLRDHFQDVSFAPPNHARSEASAL